MLEDYPLGISPNYTGVREGSSGAYPEISVTDAKRRLAFDVQDASCVYAGFCRDVKSYLVVSGVRGKMEDLEVWNSVVFKITGSKYLPPVVRKVLINGPMDRVTKKLLWTQKRRFYWHAVDTIVQNQLKSINRSRREAARALSSLRKLDNRWR